MAHRLSFVTFRSNQPRISQIKAPHVPIVKPLPTELNPSASQSHCFWNWLIWNYAIGLVALMALSIPTSERVELTGRSTWPGATRLPMHIENQGKVLPRWGRTLHQSSVPCKQFLGTDLASWKQMKQFARPSGEHRFEVPDTIPGSPPTVDISRLQAPSRHQTSSNIKLFLCQTVPLWPSAAPKSQRVYPAILRCQQYHEMLPSAHLSCTSALQ